MEAADRYSSARGTLRENVKWLAAGLAGIATLVLGTTPFTGFGALPFGSGRFAAAAICLAVAIVCTFLAWRVLMDVVRPDTTYVRFLRSSVAVGALTGRSAQEQAEYQALKDEFTANREELLPEGVTTLEGLETLLDDAWDDYQANPANAGKRDVWVDYNNNLRAIEDWASYSRLHRRVQLGIDQVQKWGLVILVALGGFAWAVNPRPADTAAAPSVVVNQEAAPPAKPDALGTTRLPPVLFDSNRFSLSEDALASIGKARDLLRSIPDAGLLLIAHTDTRGGTAVNVRLASDRARAVQRSLTREGGVATNRVYLAALPESDLPKVTAQEADALENRAVEIVAFRLPSR